MKHECEDWRWGVWIWNKTGVQFSSVQSLSHVRLFATPWITGRQASLFITNSRSLPKLMSIVSDAMQPSYPLNRVLPREHTGHSKHPLPTTQEKNTHGHHQVVNTKIRLIIFFAAKDGEALYSQQKQDRELTVAQIMNSLLPNSDLNWRKWGKPLDHSGMT